MSESCTTLSFFDIVSDLSPKSRVGCRNMPINGSWSCIGLECLKYLPKPCVTIIPQSVFCPGMIIQHLRVTCLIPWPVSPMPPLSTTRVSVQPVSHVQPLSLGPSRVSFLTGPVSGHCSGQGQSVFRDGLHSWRRPHVTTHQVRHLWGAPRQVRPPVAFHKLFISQAQFSFTLFEYARLKFAVGGI